MAFLNIAISIFFINLYGTVGATFGTAISLLVCNGLIINIYYIS